jgi:hypothetical protein
MFNTLFHIKRQVIIICHKASVKDSELDLKKKKKKNWDRTRLQKQALDFRDGPGKDGSVKYQERKSRPGIKWKIVWKRLLY